MTMDKINILNIVRDHFSTFHEHDQRGPSQDDYLLFLGVPLVSALFVVLILKFSFDSGILNSLLAAFSIFAGLLLNLLMLICAFTGSDKFAGFDAVSATRREFLREIHKNLSFSILVSIAVVVLALVGLGEIRYRPEHDAGNYPAVTFLLTFLIGNFILTMLMVLKRIHVLLSFEFGGPRASKKSA
jgi:hypothetical protein